MRQDLIVVLICISLMSVFSCVPWPSVCLLCLFRSSPPFLMVFSVFLWLSVVSSLCILDIKTFVRCMEWEYVLPFHRMTDWFIFFSKYNTGKFSQLCFQNKALEHMEWSKTVAVLKCQWMKGWGQLSSRRLSETCLESTLALHLHNAPLIRL